MQIDIDQFHHIEVDRLNNTETLFSFFNFKNICVLMLIKSSDECL